MTNRYDISESPSIIEELNKTNFHVLKTSYSYTTKHFVRRRSLTLNDPRECFRISHKHHRPRSYSNRANSSTMPASRPVSRCFRTVPKSLILNGIQNSHQSTQVSPGLLSKSPVRTAVKHLPDLFYRTPMICAVTSDSADIPNQEDQPLSAIYLVTNQVQPSPFKIARYKSYMALDNYYPKSSKIYSDIPALLRPDSQLDERGHEWCGGDLEPKQPNIDDYSIGTESTSQILQKVHKTPRGRISYQEHYRRTSVPLSNKQDPIQPIKHPIGTVSIHTSDGYFSQNHDWIIQDLDLGKSVEFQSTKVNQSELVHLVGLFIRPSTQFCLNSTINLTMNLEDEELFGIVRVANMNYQKAVIVRVSWNNWFSYTDYNAVYMFPNPMHPNHEDKSVDYFYFQIPLQFRSGKIEFAIKYSWGSTESINQTVWDNNNGKNYTIQYCRKTTFQSN